MKGFERELKKLPKFILVLIVANYVAAWLCMPLASLFDSDGNFIHSNNFIAPFIPIFPWIGRIILIVGLAKTWRQYSERQEKGLWARTTVTWLFTYIPLGLFAPGILSHSVFLPLASIPIAVLGDYGTTYGPDFTFKKYATLQTGMDEEKLFEILGQPIRDHKYPDGKRVLWYSGQKENTDYWSVRVTLNQENTVEGKHISFFYD